MQHINRHLSAISAGVWSMKVAFASSDYHHVDQHFGATPRLVVYGVKEDQVTLLKVVDFNVRYGHQEDKLTCRIDALEDCVTLYCVAIGDAVFRQLLQVGCGRCGYRPTRRSPNCYNRSNSAGMTTSSALPAASATLTVSIG
ncbi:hypothetical protein HAT93_01387 [Dickeya solani]|nr:hypothetical protein [Dickeya solani]